MAIVNGIENFTVAVEKQVGGEVLKIGSDLEQVVVKFGTQLAVEMEKQFAHLLVLIEQGKANVQADFIAFEPQLISLKNQGETAIEAVFHDSVKKVKTITDDVKVLGMNIATDASNATTYLRSIMRNDLDSAINDAKKTFDNVENDFRSKVAGHANDFITFIKNEIAKSSSNASADAASLNALKNDIEVKLQATVDAIKNDLEDAKKRMSNELDDVIAFTKNELVKLEDRISSFSNTVNNATTRIAIVAVGVGVGFLIFQVVSKNLD
jgi:hypothetical protein